MRRFPKMTIERYAQISPHNVFTPGYLSSEISRLRRDRPLPAANSFLPERDPGSAFRHGPPRAIPRSAPSLPRASRRRRKRPTWTGDVLLSVWTEEETSALRSTTAATRSCIGRSSNSMRASSAAAPEKQPPQHESPSFESWRQHGTLRA